MKNKKTFMTAKISDEVTERVPHSGDQDFIRPSKCSKGDAFSPNHCPGSFITNTLASLEVELRQMGHEDVDRLAFAGVIVMYLTKKLSGDDSSLTAADVAEALARLWSYRQHGRDEEAARAVQINLDGNRLTL